MIFQAPEWHDSLSSTNSELAARTAADEGLPNGFVLAAREQTAGRGRYDRAWIAAAGQELTFSFLLRTAYGFPQVLSLPMAVALGVADLLAGYGVAAQTKWPNDVLVQGRKICGILAERTGDAIIVGVGLNVNMSREQAAQIGRPATSVAIETGSSQPVGAVLTALLPCLDRWVGSWLNGGYAALADGWLQRCGSLGDHIHVGDGGDFVSGTLLGFGQAGQMILRQNDGRQVEVWAGDVVL